MAMLIYVVTDGNKENGYRPLGLCKNTEGAMHCAQISVLANSDAFGKSQDVTPSSSEYQIDAGTKLHLLYGLDTTEKRYVYLAAFTDRDSVRQAHQQHNAAYRAQNIFLQISEDLELSDTHLECVAIHAEKIERMRKMIVSPGDLSPALERILDAFCEKTGATSPSLGTEQRLASEVAIKPRTLN